MGKSLILDAVATALLGLVLRLRTIARPRTAIPALLVILAALAGACGGEDDEGGPGDSFSGTADYSISTANLDRELACKGGKEELSGEGENDPVLLVHGTTVTREQNWAYRRKCPTSRSGHARTQRRCETSFARTRRT